MYTPVNNVGQGRALERVASPCSTVCGPQWGSLRGWWLLHARGPESPRGVFAHTLGGAAGCQPGSGLPHSMAAGFQGLVSQARDAGRMQSHVLRKACGMGDTVDAIFGKYSVPLGSCRHSDFKEKQSIKE